MGIEVLQPASDTLVVNLFDVLSHAEFTQAQKSAGEFLREQGPMRILINVGALKAFAPGDWGDLSFQLPDESIVKMAIVGDTRMKDLALMFTGKGLRKFPIEFFSPQESQAARAWLQQGEPPSKM